MYFMNISNKIKRGFAIALSMSAIFLASCSESINTSLERRVTNEKAFLEYASNTEYKKVSLPGAYGDRYVYMKWTTEAADRSQKPKATDYIRMYYTGRILTTEQVIDTNTGIASTNLITPMVINRGAGNKLVDGMAIALQNMAVGDKATVIIPWYLAYGETGAGNIPSYTALNFEIELKEIVGDTNE